ncbi:MAG TPA: hypothetical protein VIN58_20470 [Roseateles sp.]
MVVNPFKLLRKVGNWLLSIAACVAIHGCAVPTPQSPAAAEVRAKEIALGYIRNFWPEERIKTRTVVVKKVGLGWDVYFHPPEGTIGGGAVVTIDSALEVVDATFSQ